MIKNNEKDNHFPNIWKLYKTFVSNSRVKYIAMEIGKYFQLNDCWNRTHQKLWVATKLVFREKCIALSAYIREYKRFKINDLKKLEKLQQIKPK